MRIIDKVIGWALDNPNSFTQIAWTLSACVAILFAVFVVDMHGLTYVVTAFFAFLCGVVSGINKAFSDK